MVGDRGGFGFSKRATIQLITEGFKFAASSPREPPEPFRNCEFINQQLDELTKPNTYISKVSSELISVHVHQFLFNTGDVASEKFIGTEGAGLSIEMPECVMLSIESKLTHRLAAPVHRRLLTLPLNYAVGRFHQPFHVPRQT